MAVANGEAGGVIKDTVSKIASGQVAGVPSNNNLGVVFYSLVTGSPIIPAIGVRLKRFPTVCLCDVLSRLALFGCIRLTGVIACPPLASAAPPRKVIIDRSIRSSAVADSSTYDFGFGKALDIFSSSTDTSLYDPLTIATLKQLQEDSKPQMGPDDIDVSKTRRVVEKAFAIQSGRSFSQLMNGSELRSMYRDMLHGIEKVQNLFRYSLQRDSQGLVLSRENKGKKLLEFKLEMSLKQGFDPQVHLSENFRFRYDYTEKRPMIEYGFRF